MGWPTTLISEKLQLNNVIKYAQHAYVLQTNPYTSAMHIMGDNKESRVT